MTGLLPLCAVCRQPLRQALARRWVHKADGLAFSDLCGAHVARPQVPVDGDQTLETTGR